MASFGDLFADPMSGYVVPGLDDADTLPWDSSLPFAAARPDRANAGCPLGYFTQYVAPGSLNATTTGPGVAVRCRRMPADLVPQPDGSPSAEVQTVINESGTTAGETVQMLTAAVGDTVGQVGGALAHPFGFSWTTIVIVAAALYALSIIGPSRRTA